MTTEDWGGEPKNTTALCQVTGWPPKFLGQPTLYEICCSFKVGKRHVTASYLMWEGRGGGGKGRREF